ncbi:MAG: matrixin family metalloprotease [Deltaproteobacteria bacterium]|nr:matrixin family metalloprotease [Deltaproteobacteria bacterium]
MTTPQRIICSILSLVLLSSCALTGPSVPQRIVRVRVLADPSFRENNVHWAEEAAGLIEAASDYFEREFGIRLVTQRISPWPLQDRASSAALLLSRLKEGALLKDQDGSFDLIIGLTRERFNVYFGGRARVDRIGNCQEGLGNYMVSSVSAPFIYRGPAAEPELDVVALIHELGHIFGAEHTQDTGSIMHEHFDYRTEFDKRSREVILKNKFCPFGKG